MENKEIQIQNAMIEVLTDTIDEQKRIQKRQSGIIVLLICLLFASFCSFLIYLNQFDYEDTQTITTTNNAKAYDENNSINAHINDIKINSKEK